MYTRCWRNAKEGYIFSSRNFWKEPNFLTMQIHKIYLMSTWLIGVQGSAMQEVVLILPGKRPVFLVDLLRAGRQVSSWTCPLCPPAGRREVWEATWLNHWWEPENAYPLSWVQTRMCHFFFPFFFLFQQHKSCAGGVWEPQPNNSRKILNVFQRKRTYISSAASCPLSFPYLHHPKEDSNH